MACAGAIGALLTMSRLDFGLIEQRNTLWEEALSNHPYVKNIRRIGAFMAIELKSADAVQHVVHARLHPSQGDGALVFWFLSVPNAFRLAPPLTCSDEEMATGLKLVLRALDHAG